MKKNRFLAKVLACAVIGTMTVPNLVMASSWTENSDWYDEEGAQASWLDFDQQCAALVDATWRDDFTVNGNAFQMMRLIVKAADGFDAAAYNPSQVVTDSDAIYVLQFDSVEATETAYNAISASGTVSYVEPDQLITVTNTAKTAPAANITYPYTQISQGARTLGIDEYVDYLRAKECDNPMYVGSVDSGIAYDETSPLWRKTTYNGYDYVAGNDDVDGDANGHGTHVGGIVADSVMNFGDIDIQQTRVLNENGQGSLLNLVNGLVHSFVECYTVTCGVALGEIHSDYLAENMSNMLSQSGNILVIPAGNQGAELVNDAAYLKDAIIVGSVDSNDNITSYSNYGDLVDFVAPGEDVYTFDNVAGGYTYTSGTEMAMAQLAGAVSLLKYENAPLSASEVEEKLMSACTDLGEAGKDAYYGNGMPNMKKLLSDYLPQSVSIRSAVTYSNPEEDQKDLEADFVAGDEWESDLVWESSDPSVARIDWQDGDMCGIDAMKDGKATVKVYFKSYPEISSTCEVTIDGYGAAQNFTTDGLTSDFFNISGKLASDKGTVTYKDMTLTNSLKMESNTSVSFTSEGCAYSDGQCKLTLVGNAGDDKKVKIDGQSYTMTNGQLTVFLPKGTHTITKDNGSVYLYYMQVSYEV